MNKTTKQISIQELHDREITEELLVQVFSAFTCVFEYENIDKHIDESMTAYTGNKKTTYNIEIKEWKGTENLPKFIWLKKRKLELMKKDKYNDRLIYLMFNKKRQEAYFFNIDKIDWSKIQCDLVEQYITEYNKGRGKSYFETYKIPIKYAKIYKCHI